MGNQASHISCPTLDLPNYGRDVFSNVGSGRDVLLLTTKGRRTGKDRKFERTNPWVINLCSDPNAQIQIGSDTTLYHAREATNIFLASSFAELYPSTIVIIYEE